MTDPTPEELAEVERLRTEKAAEGAKTQFFAMMDEWADKRSASAAPAKTPSIPRPGPLQFLEGILGPRAVPDPPKEVPKGKTA